MFNEHYTKTRRFFDNIARNADGLYDSEETIAFRVQQAVRTQLLTMLDVTGSDVILDAGCGRGDFSIELAQTYPNSAIVGIDFVQMMLRLGNANKVKAELENVSFHAADLRKLPFPDHYFSSTVCLNTIHHINSLDLPQMVAELARVTKRTAILEIKNNLSPWHVIKKIRMTISKPNLPIYGSNHLVMRKLWGQAGFYLSDMGGVLGPGVLAPIILLRLDR